MPTAKEQIERGEWVNCWVCEKLFRRRRETKRYCMECEKGFCEGEHGSFARGYGVCILHELHAADR